MESNCGRSFTQLTTLNKNGNQTDKCRSTYNWGRCTLSKIAQKYGCNQCAYSDHKSKYLTYYSLAVCSRHSFCLHISTMNRLLSGHTQNHFRCAWVNAFVMFKIRWGWERPLMVYLLQKHMRLALRGLSFYGAGGLFSIAARRLFRQFSSSPHVYHLQSSQMIGRDAP